jgi:RNA polymerase sigma factor (sigma-70 family)
LQAERNRLITAGSRVRLRLAGDERLVALVRRGDIAAFEVLYERHAGALLSFCMYMLGSRHDAEDAVQATFASAHRALLANRRAVNLRPWLFTIARNDCLSILRKRRPTVELNGELALRGDPPRELELREEVLHMLEGLRELPEPQRAALVLAEMHGLSHAEIGAVLGVEPGQIKAYVFQARSNLISERRAREADCREIREELATARGAALLRGRLRRHVRACADCRAYADGVALHRRQLGALLPLAPSLLLKYRALEDALGIISADPATYAGGATVAGSVVAGTAAEIAGGGIKALAVKMAAGVAILGATAGVGASVLSSSSTDERESASTTQAAQLPLLAAAPRASTVGWTTSSERPQLGGESSEGSTHSSQPPVTSLQQDSSAPTDGGGLGTPGASGGKERGGTSSEGQQGGAETHKGRTPTGEHGQQSPEERQKKNEEGERHSQERQAESKEDQQESQERQKANEERH